MKFLPLALLLFASSANAQNLSPSQMAIAITNAVNQMSAALDQLQKENADLKKQLDDENKQGKPENK